MYTIYVKFECVDGKREAFVERVEKEGILKAIREEDGCYKYDYYFSQKDKNELLLIEKWESKNHQQIHINQPHMKVLREFQDEYIVNAEFGEIKF